jgi:HlyD family secretion protein
MKASLKKPLWILAAVVVAAAAAWYAWTSTQPDGPGEGFVRGNGRIEATEIDIATRIPGRIDAIVVHEGEFVEAGQPLARINVQVLEAQRDEARALLQQAMNNVVAVQAQLAMRESDRAAAQAVVAQRESELDAARRRLARSETLVRQGATAMQELDDHRAGARGAEAAVGAARAQVAAAQAAVEAVRAQIVGARSAVSAAQATIARIQADIDDSQLAAPRAGRVQYIVAQPGEVLAAGGKLLNLVDLSDVYMSLFLPETVAGRVALGTEVRVVLDVAPNYPIPAAVSFVAATAQFTPKTVETASERQKLMFRVKARIDRELLLRYREQVKTGLPGVAWIKLDPDAAWPESLAIRTPL